MRNRYCNRCGHRVVEESDESIDYPYYCPNCDENMYGFETSVCDEPPNGRKFFVSIRVIEAVDSKERVTELANEVCDRASELIMEEEYEEGMTGKALVRYNEDSEKYEIARIV